MTFDCNKVSLKRGSKGEQVKKLQTILKQKGYYTRRIDGEYGQYTEQAVKKLQKAQGNSVDGWFGQKTCKKLQTSTNTKTTNNTTNTPDTPNTTTLKKGSKGEQVKTLQNKLQLLGYYNQQIDGEYGTLTENAVKQYQTYYNLVSDGITGEITQKTLQETTPLKETTNSKTLSKYFGIHIKDHGTLYQAVLKKGKYNYYNNDIYTYKQEINRVTQGQGINCTDWAQLGMQLLLEMGFKKEFIRIVRGTVTCTNNDKTYGHVWLQLYINGVWVNYDLSAAACHGSKIGTLICTKNPLITNINSAWAVSDDGIT